LNGPTASVPPVAGVFFPLDDELALLPSRYTPHVHEALVRLGAWMPFAQAAALLDHLLGVQVSADTLRRQTEAAGDAFVACQSAEAEFILQTSPPSLASSDRLVVSADGAMVPLRQGEWGEVKTVAVGEVDLTGKTTKLSYFSRLCDAATFTELATAELSRRGVPQAEQVAAVVDGAEWLQGFLDVQCPQAVRILDFPHAAQRVSQISHALFGEGSVVQQEWLARQLKTLAQQGPQPLLAAIEKEVRAEPMKAAKVAEDLAYLEKRVGQMQYPAYQARGWPIGSGIVESANKLVVEARLKGAGMHWERTNVNGMLALRTIVCSARWEEVWGVMVRQLRQQAEAQRRKRHAEREGQGVPAQEEQTARQEEVRQGRVPVEVLRAALAEEKPQPHPWKRAWSVRRQIQEIDQPAAARL
jgi:hypothetical protein